MEIQHSLAMRRANRHLAALRTRRAVTRNTSPDVLFG
jgi:hypothetical protein